MLQVAQVVVELHAVDNDASGVVLLESVDGANKRGLTGPGWSEDDDNFAFGNRRRNALERLEVAEPLFDVFALNDRGTGARLSSSWSLSHSNSERSFQAVAEAGHGERDTPKREGDEEEHFFLSSDEVRLRDRGFRGSKRISETQN